MCVNGNFNKYVKLENYNNKNNKENIIINKKVF